MLLLTLKCSLKVIACIILPAVKVTVGEWQIIHAKTCHEEAFQQYKQNFIRGRNEDSHPLTPAYLYTYS